MSRASSCAWKDAKRKIKPMHILSAEQFTRDELVSLFDASDRMRQDFETNRHRLATRHQGRQVTLLFYEPSTRTRLSFSHGAHHLGMAVNATENAKEFSSASKGETLEDTLQMMKQYHSDIVVIRHYETGIIARAAAQFEGMSIINAGDGKGEHPTQSLLDLYTIHREVGRSDNLRVVIGGDLKRGRTARSLAKILTNFPGNHVVFVSTPELQVDEDVQQYLKTKGLSYELTDDPLQAVKGANVIYWTRMQDERSAERFDPFVIDTAFMRHVPKDAILMHPLPRVTEIAPEVDADSRAKYFDQAGNGMFMRMALMDRILARK